MTNHFFVTIILAIKYEALLNQLQLMHEEHEKNTDKQRDKRRVKRNTQTLCNACNIALHGLVCLRQRLTNTAYGADKPNLWNRPGNIANHRQFGLESISLGLADGVCTARNILNVAGRTESPQCVQQRSRQ